MRAITYLITLLLFAKLTFAEEVAVQTGVQWIDLQRMAHLQASAQRHFEPQQSQWLALPAHAWLVIKPAALDNFQFRIGETPKLLRQIDKTQWLCVEQRCQLGSARQHRLIEVTYHGQQAQSLALWQGNVHRHRDPFRRALALPGLDTKVLKIAQSTQRWYHLAPTDKTTVFFTQAKKLKITVRKDLHEVIQNGIVTVKVNGKVISRISVSDLHAAEYLQPKAGLVNQDYIAVPQGSYLTITSSVPVYLNVVQMHRGIFDDNAGQKQLETLFNPYWSQQLDSQLQRLYFSNDRTDVETAATDSVLTIARKQAMRGITSSLSFVSPSSPNKLITQAANVAVTLGSRSVTDDVKLVTGSQHIAYTQSSSTLTYHLDDIPIIDNAVTVFVRATQQQQLLLHTEHDQYRLHLSPSAHFQRLTLPIHPASTFITVQGSILKRDVALAVNRLQPFPKFNAMTQEGLRSSEFISRLLTHNRNNRANSYNLSLTTLRPPTLNLGLTSAAQFHATKSLIELRMQASTLPIQTLAKVKPFLNGYNEQVTLLAWQLNIDVLSQLARTGNAELLLKSLLLSNSDMLKKYAANTLLTHYVEATDYIQAAGLCAGYSPYITEYQCDNIELDYLIQSGAHQEALWMSQTMSLAQHQVQLLATLQSNQISSPQYSLSHHGQHLAHTIDKPTQLYRVDRGEAVQLTANTPLTLKVSARTAFQGQQYKNTQWLYYQQDKAINLLPVYADIPANMQLQSDNTRLSIATRQQINLAAGESIHLFSNSELFLDIQITPPLAAAPPVDNQAVKLISDAQSIVSAEFSVIEVAVNALYHLSQQTLNNEQYHSALQRLHTSLTDNITHQALYARLLRYGQWRPVQQYTSYLGTQKVSTEADLAKSYADQITAHLTQTPLSGLQLRANELLTIDFTQYQHLQTRITLRFSDAMQVSTPPAQVELIGHGSGTVLTLQAGETFTHGIKPDEARASHIQLRWLNPISGQMVGITPQYYSEGRWHDIELDTRQIFYRSDKQTPVTATLSQDSLIKIESMENGTRKEANYFHPAGQVSLTATGAAALVRMSVWSLSPTLSRVNLTPTPEVHLNTQVRPDLNAMLTPYQNPRLEMDESQMGIAGFLVFDSDDIVQTTEPTPNRITLDLGLSLRLKEENNWYRLDTFYTLDNHHQDTFSINGKYDWLSQYTNWFAEVQLRNRWQNSTALSDSHLTSRLSSKLGQIHRYNSGFRSIWWWQPFYTYTSINKDEFIADAQISPDMYTFYRNNHRHGWQAHAGLRYQPWVDSYIDSSATLTSNQDWQTFDNMLLSINWNQYHEGHIFRLGLTSRYVFADQHRPNPTWQYLTQVGWQTGFDFSTHTAGWLSLTWTQDWFNNTHQIGFQVHLGNLQQTGFAPYAHDEIVFESLQLGHLLEQDLHDQ
ncbi:hypothetical protein EAG18_09885 [Pseudoalteromonas sp. J010]|uniref:hypothetical protein n=1 Tax=Pseudoalteromonas sp. J010 TaxID=998465 RepID=UPI000F649326|nr:hypothetical protein [Pseudoalteromonas sp. J010]RRS08830.1 hypothetical protein EAG18_09885 [Pseudoalteromonas sp. J010]